MASILKLNYIYISLLKLENVSRSHYFGFSAQIIILWPKNGAVCSRFRSPGESSQECAGDTAMALLNKVTRDRLFADNEMWILAALPVCFFSYLS